MENTTLLLIALLGVYLIFKAVTATIDFVFKIVAGLLILSFLGYSVLDWEHINSVPITMQDNTTMAEIPQEQAPIAPAITGPANSTQPDTAVPET